MIKKKCKHCNKELEFKNYQQFGAHITNCKLNPNLKDIHKNISKSMIKRKRYEFICKGCNKKFYQEITPTQYDNKRFNTFCSKSCSSKYRKLSLETKRKISKSLGGDGIAICERKINKRTTEYYKQNYYKRKRILWWEQECKCNHCSYNLHDPINGPYEIHHLDGNHNNRQRWNEELLCCNCHRLTDNWGFKDRCHTDESKKLISKNHK